MQTLIGLPDGQGYTVKTGNGVLRVQLDGGAGAYRADELNSSSIVNVQWSLDPFQYLYFTSFYRASTAANKGSNPFQATLIVDDATAELYTCYIMPGTWQLKSQTGLQYVVGVQLEVISNPKDDSYDSSLVDTVTGANSTELPIVLNYINLLQQLVNFDFQYSGNTGYLTSAMIAELQTLTNTPY